MTHLRARDYLLKDVDQSTARALVEAWHYSKGGPRTAVHRHGLFHVDAPDTCLGVAWWLPPTKPAARSVAGDQWRTCLALTRLVVHPDLPTNAASFLLGRSIRLIRQERRWTHLLTYADSRQGHEGTIYRATNWQYLGAMKSAPVWLDSDGRQVSTLSTTTRTYAQMEALGFTRRAGGVKHKFALTLPAACRAARKGAIA